MANQEAIDFIRQRKSADKQFVKNTLLEMGFSEAEAEEAFAAIQKEPAENKTGPLAITRVPEASGGAAEKKSKFMLVIVLAALLAIAFILLQFYPLIKGALISR